MPRASQSAATSETASSSPEIVTLCGLLMHATVAFLVVTLLTSSLASDLVAPTAIIEPTRFGCLCFSKEIHFPRKNAMAMQSSMLRQPAAHAAAISPLEWPTTADGEMPHERSRSTNASWIAVHAGWLMCALEMAELDLSFLNSPEWAC